MTEGTEPSSTPSVPASVPGKIWEGTLFYTFRPIRKSKFLFEIISVHKFHYKTNGFVMVFTILSIIEVKSRGQKFGYGSRPSGCAAVPLLLAGSHFGATIDPDHNEGRAARPGGRMRQLSSFAIHQSQFERWVCAASLFCYLV